MKKIKITTPENIELEVVLAEMFSRITAAMIDSIIQCVIAGLIGWGFLEIILHSISDRAEYFYGWVIGGFIIIEIIVIYGYYILSETIMCGGTIGKKVMHLRVIRNNGGPVTIKHIVIRNLFRVFIDNFGIGMFFMLFNKKGQRVGDIVAGTMVIIEESQEKPVALDELIIINDEVKSYLSEEEYALLREYLDRRKTMTDYDPLRKQMKAYFKEKLMDLGIYEENTKFIDAL